MRFLTGVFLALAMALPAAAQAPGATHHVAADLIASRNAIAPGETIYVALHQKIETHWHTYWRNSGDSGEPTRIKWDLPAGWSAGEIVWPAPKRIPVGPLMNYGYEDDVLLPVPLTAPANAKAGDKVTLKAQVSLLVCAEVCVPEDDALSLTLPVVATPAAPGGGASDKVMAAVAAAPKPAGLAAVYQVRPAGVALAITGAALKGADAVGAYFFPFESTVIDHAKPQAIERGPQGLTLTLAPGYGFQGGKSPASVGGVIEVGDKAYEVAATPGVPPAGASGLGPPAAKGAGGADLGLAAAALFAFLGGLILNLMPCVFPILAMKAASLAGHGGSENVEARRQGLAFGAGSVLTFLALAGGLIALKAAGSAIGWGFQLQSPPVVAVLCLLMLGVALNLSGLFEVGTSMQGAGSGLASRGGALGSFFTGALAVVVAAPCTAPFMGPALGWALTQTPAAALTVFLALGVGFAAPFVLVAYAPGLLSRLPKPGAWMETFRKALAFPMYGAAAWLAWVLSQQAGPEDLAKLFAAAVLVGLAAWLAGLSQKRAAMGRKPVLLTAVAGAAAAIAVATVVWPQDKTAELQSEPYSPARVAELRAEGRPVFVNYTAAWCVSCQVNDKVALSTHRVAQAFGRHKVAYLKADWTKRDGAIAAELAAHGRAGVPLYLVYGTGGGDGVILPSILTPDIVVKAVEAADKH
ncbi:protein-disulfide reductase DsbD family protein [Phenylobacterium sp.]|jgi:thiol:disulfide interchange protein DsbD|uniref:protein-disulfide reductase DsbD family protein n=1 Tax=Phenylobacterium sp. TaxID=1871053 RepID=UPI002E31A058|nr:protein-disulfide reductase DsbD domain-containing protein [Phenylobacterium sp.]HEX3367510.1 protein-disulfide reductase DsbD domain-containing protein [Phenylobacterium sp.]